MLQRYGVPKFHSFLQQIGLKTINRSSSHYGLSLILGGAEATLWDVTNAYAMMGRSLLQLPQRSCSLLLPTSRITESTDPFQPGAVWQTFDALKEVNRPEEIDWKSIPSMQTIAWKTGTSYGFRDAWAVGVTPRYAVGVWVGNATGEGKPGLVGAQTAGPVLFDIFNYLPSSPWFERPTEIFVDAEICRQSGHLKGRSSQYPPTKATASMKTVQTRNLPFRNHGLPCRPYGNGTINNTIRNINRCHLSKPAAEKILSNPCSSSTLR